MKAARPHAGGPGARRAAGPSGYRYLALLRGINVGGANVIRMADLKACFEGVGLGGVSTYIQSGNVLFGSGEKSEAKLTATLEKALAERFGLGPCIVLVTPERLQTILSEAPAGFGGSPDEYRYDVIFLKRPMTAAEAIREVRTREGVDTAHAGSEALYVSRLIRLASRSQLSRLTQAPAYRFMTIRNWNTTTKLASLLAGSASAP